MLSRTRVHLCLLTGSENRYPYLRETVEYCSGWFDSIRIFDHGSTDATTTLQNHPAVQYRLLGHQQSDWRSRYGCVLDDIPMSDWYLLVDSDERPSPQLLHNLQEDVAFLERRGKTIAALPGLLHVDGELRPSRPGGARAHFARWPRNHADFQSNPCWTKQPLLKRTAATFVEGAGPHCRFAQHGCEPHYIPHHYNHYKSGSQLVASVVHCSWEAIDSYGVPVGSKEFDAHQRMRQRTGLTTSADLQTAIRNNAVPTEALQYLSSLRDSPFDTLVAYWSYAFEHDFQVTLCSQACDDACCDYQVRGLEGPPAPLQRLRLRFPWPEHRPDVTEDFGPVWFLDEPHGHTGPLDNVIPRDANVIVELGSLVGRSTRAILRIRPAAHVVSIDTWCGSPEFDPVPELRQLVPRMYDTFLANLWTHRDRLTPVRATTIRGMVILDDLGVQPDAFYVDADHSQASVEADIHCIHRRFPTARIVGDDWKWDSVRAGVTSVATELGATVSVDGTVWWLEFPGRNTARSRLRTIRDSIDRVVVITLFNRPQYAQKVITALSHCDGIDRTLVLMHVEPGNDEVRHIARTTPFDFKLVIENSSVLGCTSNTFSAMDHGFQFADFVIALEDDVVPSRDFLRFFDWARDAYSSSPDIFSVCAYSKDEPTADKYFRVRRSKYFVPWGWGTWADRWKEIRPQWGFGAPDSWDIVMNRIRGERYQVSPILARCQNIGANAGTHCPNPEWHREHQFNGFGAWSVELGAGAFTEA